MANLIEALRLLAKQMGLTGLIITITVTLAATVFTVNIALPHAVDSIDDTVVSSGPDVPEGLKEDLSRGDIEAGRDVGATPNRSLPRPEHLKNYKFIASPNWSGRGACGVEAVVQHIAGSGSMAGMDSWFSKNASQVSAHFGIDKDGTVHQYVDLGDSAWHAGIVNRPDLSNPLILDWVRSGTNPNRCTVGIELMLAGPAEPLSRFPEMEQSLSDLLEWLEIVTEITLTRTDFIGHYQLDSVNRASDPICCVDFDRVLAEITGPIEPPSEWQGCDPAWGGWWNDAIRRWVAPGSALFEPEAGVWASPPLCPQS